MFSEDKYAVELDASLSLVNECDFDWANYIDNTHTATYDTDSIFPPSPSDSCFSNRAINSKEIITEFGDVLIPTIANRSSMTPLFQTSNPTSSPLDHSPSPCMMTSPAKQMPSPPPPTLCRRRPGRPPKSQIAMQSFGGNRPDSHSQITIRRKTHNDSVMRSRTKFNTALDELWEEVPEQMRLEMLGANHIRQISRAEKVEIITSYFRKLKMKTLYYHEIYDRSL